MGLKTLLADDAGSYAAEVTSTAFPTAGLTFGSESELADYSYITSKDSSYVSQSPSGAYAGYYVELKPNVAVNNITQIDLTATAYGEGVESGNPFNDANLYIWNANTPGLELIDNHTADSLTDLTGSVTTDISDYLEDGVIKLIVCIDDGDGNNSTLYFDYIEAEITYNSYNIGR
jgi:hypothetical protein